MMRAMEKWLKIYIAVVATGLLFVVASGGDDYVPRSLRIDGPITVSGGGGGYSHPISVPSTIADVSYKTTLTLGSNDRLTVWPSAGAPVVLAHHPISAQYFHMGRILVVEVGKDTDDHRFHHFVEPIRWETSPKK